VESLCVVTFAHGPPKALLAPTKSAWIYHISPVVLYGTILTSSHSFVSPRCAAKSVGETLPSPLVRVGAWKLKIGPAFIVVVALDVLLGEVEPVVVDDVESLRPVVAVVWLGPVVDVPPARVNSKNAPVAISPTRTIAAMAYVRLVKFYREIHSPHSLKSVIPA